MSGTLPEVNLRGKVAIVTGATSGLGKEIARSLSRMKATVIVPARDPKRGKDVRDEISLDTGNPDVSVVPLDLASIASIRGFAAMVQRRHQHVHLLVNNAGAWFSDRRESADGHELTFATNVLGPYLLSSLFTETLKRSTPARIVNVISNLASNYDEADLNYRRRKYDGFKAYGQSKQALRMLTFGLARRLEGTGVTVNAAAPGFVSTDLNRNAKGFLAMMINLSAKLMAVSPAEGALTPTWAAVAPELATVTGKCFDKQKELVSKYREEGPIAELERRCEEMVRERVGSVAA